ncbi:MAG: hypothetical protein GX066_03565 [Clostridiaceae bacterium]|nr:hypothetical protein [Clostridiaceae bacterium]
MGFDGQIYYLGRNDNQVKIRGVRIDLSEIESNALKIDGVRQAKCIVSDKKLLLYYTASEPIPDIRHALSKNIPANRMPSAIIYLDDMPLLPSGKIDKSALKKLPVPPNDYVPPKTDMEVLLCNEIVKQLKSEGVKIDKISITENIFDAGVDSLSIISIVLNLNKIGIPVSFQDFYQSPTVRELATKNFKLKPMEYLQYGGHNTVVLCFPYAGGHPHSFSLLTKGISNADVVGVNYDYFDRDTSVEEISKFFVNLVKDYENIQIVGVCIGSAFALETTYQLEALGKKVEHLTLIGSLPMKFPKIFGYIINPWQLLTPSMLNAALSRLSGKKVVLSGKFIEQFKVDTQRFFSYMDRRKKGNIYAPVRLIFADGDKFTKGYKKKYTRWNRYTGGSLQVIECHSDSHFFVEEIPLNLL